jgi:hypothetical protein
MSYLPLHAKGQVPHSSGQALLIVLLTMAVVLTIVLSILSRSITDIKVTSQDEESLRAFSAAEAGVEQALVVGTGADANLFGTTHFSVDVDLFSEGKTKFVFPSNYSSLDPVYTWFVAHDDDGKLSSCSDPLSCFTGASLAVCWGKKGASPTPALEATIFYTLTPGDYATAQIARVAVDPDASRRGLNSFSEPDVGTCTIDETTLAFKKTIDFASLEIPEAVFGAANGLQFMTLKLIYNADAQPLGVDAGGSAFPSQGKIIASEGSSGTANRRLEVFQGYQEIPAVFASAIFSTGGLVK